MIIFITNILYFILVANLSDIKFDLKEVIMIVGAASAVITNFLIIKFTLGAEKSKRETDVNEIKKELINVKTELDNFEKNQKEFNKTIVSSFEKSIDSSISISSSNLKDNFNNLLNAHTESNRYQFEILQKEISTTKELNNNTRKHIEQILETQSNIKSDIAVIRAKLEK
jgi:predicted  nucleic acid-binding Zn-ribbon protein